jgi:hypothetical protein
MKQYPAFGEAVEKLRAGGAKAHAERPERLSHPGGTRPVYRHRL